MKKVIEIKHLSLVEDMMNTASYGTLGLCKNNQPYMTPINFVVHDGAVFFHGAQKGRKMSTMQENEKASFSVVEPYSQLPSYFSNDKGNAAPATHLFKSLYIEGIMKQEEMYKNKAQALESLMQKYQKEGGYTALNDAMYEKIINATAIFKLVPTEITCKIKLGQNFTKERYERVRNHLLKRATPLDLQTVKLLDEYQGK